MADTLAHILVGDRAAPRCALFLHGIFGSSKNLRSLARRLTSIRPDYTCVLADLRCHGGSVAIPPPHSLKRAAQDLVELTGELGRLPSAVIGHSFGGKVALVYAKLEPRLRQVWALDSDPGPRSDEPNGLIEGVLAALESVPVPLSSRQEAAQRLERHGLSRPLSDWLCTSLVRRDGQYVWALDLSGIRMLMRDYLTTDMWPFLERPNPGLEIHLVAAENSDHTAAARRTLEHCLAESRTVHVHHLANSGHWVHVDNPEGLLELLAGSLPGD